VKSLGLNLLLLFHLGLNSCATTTLPPFGKEAALQLEEDEKRLWVRSQEAQKKLDSSDAIYQAPELTAYLNDVAQKVIPEQIRVKGPSIRIRVIKSPHVNAFALPHGPAYILTGFLAMMENEAQLAAVLAHEITHITHRHSIQQFRTVKGTAAAMTTLQVVAAPAGVYGIAPVLLGALGGLTAVMAYSREQETEADRIGFDLLVNAGYDPEEAIKLFDRVKKYEEEQEIQKSFFFATHPHLQERKENYAQIMQNRQAGNRVYNKGAARFAELVQPVLLDNAELDLAMGRFGLAKETIERFLQKEPKSARGHYYLGEVYRKRAGESDLRRAEEAYQLAAQYDPSYADPRKGLGLIYLKEGQKEKARKEFEGYLSLAPRAQDKGYVEQYLRETAEK
jgi:predicted Zn-dependent protease